MITFQGVACLMGRRLLYENVDLKLLPRRRYGLLGANGAGKSTLLKMIMGEEDPFEGFIEIPKTQQVGWLHQDHFRYENDRIIDVVIQGKPELWQAMHEKEIILSSGEWSDEIGYRVGELEEIIADKDGYVAEAQAHVLLTGLGIEESKHFEKLSILSGGFKLRVLLAQTLFANPDILLLDEPTNHLDAPSIAWLEDYLINQHTGLMLTVSHDRHFINTVSTDIIDIDYGEIRHYVGNYDYFVQQKVLVEEQRLKEKKHIDDKLKQMNAFIDRFRAKSSKAKQVQSRIKMVDKVQIPDIQNSSRVYPGFDFKSTTNPGKVILTVENIAKAYGDKQVLQKVDFVVNRGDHMAIVGPNGIGKSTLLKILTNNIVPDTGTFEWGHETKIAYFSQDHNDVDQYQGNTFEWLRQNVVNKDEQVMRNYMGRVLLGGEFMSKKLSTLSGGEKTRLIICKMMLEDANVLILDEPTNHLDMEAIDALKKALISFKGTVLFVSHDQYFVSGAAEKILEITQFSTQKFHSFEKNIS